MLYRETQKTIPFPLHNKYSFSPETITTEEEAESCLLELLRADREYRWRYGLVELLRKCKGQDQCHRALLFLYSIVGIKFDRVGINL